MDICFHLSVDLVISVFGSLALWILMGSLTANLLVDTASFGLRRNWGGLAFFTWPLFWLFGLLYFLWLCLGWFGRIFGGND